MQQILTVIDEAPLNRCFANLADFSTHLLSQQTATAHRRDNHG
ncbi:MAG: hypothetical protein AB2693_00890 [Candidatus Thiodiazotropha sp.]